MPRLILFKKGKIEGASPLQNLYSPSPLKERGIKGVRLISSLKKEVITHGILGV